MKRRPWITGKALETVLALRPVQPGDEIKFKRNSKKTEAHRGLQEGRAYPVLADSFKDFDLTARAWGGPDEPVCRGLIPYRATRHYFSNSNIAALRIKQEVADDSTSEV